MNAKPFGVGVASSSLLHALPVGEYELCRFPTAMPPTRPRRTSAARICRPGPRLVNSFGILWLAATSGVLLSAFGGITDRLIPLFAIGTFLAFTLSQSGMAIHWLRQPREGSGLCLKSTRLPINATGAIATGVSLAIILAAKFVEGA
jgi:hypothetical protein